MQSIFVVTNSAINFHPSFFFKTFQRAHSPVPSSSPQAFHCLKVPGCIISTHSFLSHFINWRVIQLYFTIAFAFAKSCNSCVHYSLPVCSICHFYETTVFGIGPHGLIGDPCSGNRIHKVNQNLEIIWGTWINRRHMMQSLGDPYCVRLVLFVLFFLFTDVSHVWFVIDAVNFQSKLKKQLHLNNRDTKTSNKPFYDTSLWRLRSPRAMLYVDCPVDFTAWRMGCQAAVEDWLHGKPLALLHVSCTMQFGQF